MSMHLEALASYTRDLLGLLGEDAEREGLVETPQRVARSYAELYSGYLKTEEDLQSIYKEFETTNDCMVIQQGIPVLSMCEHHMLPFLGTCNVGFIPKLNSEGRGKTLGLSKLTRIVEHHSRRLQIQEQLTQQIADCINTRLDCLGVMVVMKCLHLCMCLRGVKTRYTPTITSANLGVFRTQPETRQEFMVLAGDIHDLF